MEDMQMQWLEVSIETAPGGIDLLAARLTALGYDSFIMDDCDQFHDFLEENQQYWDYVDEELEQSMQGVSRIRLYLEDNEASRQEIDALRAKLAEFRAQEPSAPLGSLAVSYTTMRDEDWENSWKQYYQPLPIGERLLVVPQWLDPENPDGRIPVLLDPGMIFGTGQHASTRMCMESLEQAVHGGETVLDLGSGSGILSIAALLLGAKEATGVDIDPKAEDIARENAAMNDRHGDRFTALTANVLESREKLSHLRGKCQIVLANIVADVIIPLSPIVPEFLAENGVFICSGILQPRLPEVERAIEQAGLRITDRRLSEDWAALTAVRA
jgi:ribosomal protein L11 methyltransferase